MACFELTLCLAGAPGSVFLGRAVLHLVSLSGWLVQGALCQSAPGAVSPRDPSASCSLSCSLTAGKVSAGRAVTFN